VPSDGCLICFVAPLPNALPCEYKGQFFNQLRIVRIENGEGDAVALGATGTALYMRAALEESTQQRRLEVEAL